MNLRFASFVFVLTLFCGFIGCAEVDDFESFRELYDCDQAMEALVFDYVELGEIDMSDPNNLQSFMANVLAQVIAGVWDGKGNSSDRRIAVEDDGQYRISEKRGTRWVVINQGKCHVEFGMFQGELHPELHMLMDGVDDEYVVRFNMKSEDEIEFEEPLDGENAMVFIRAYD